MLVGETTDACWARKFTTSLKCSFVNYACNPYPYQLTYNYRYRNFSELLPMALAGLSNYMYMYISGH